MTGDAGAAEVVIDWMLSEGRRNPHMREFGDEMCRRIVAAGIPISRAFCGIRTLHPLVAATAYVWHRDEPGARRLVASYEDRDSAAFRTSPPARVQQTGETIRRRLEGPEERLDFEILRQFKSEGATDYLAQPLVFSSGELNSITWQTDRPGGFSDADIAALTRIANVLAPIVETQSARRIAAQLMNTYVGRRTGRRVLDGAITRGSGEEIEAVIWFSDLRGFTALTDRLPRETLIVLLNDYFGAVGEAVTGEGGEILKFVGDAMLAIFEIGGDTDAATCCAAALRAADRAVASVGACNRERAANGAPEIAFGVALHRGAVTYGNIGTPDRLDFTVIGPAVNHAARLQALAAEHGHRVVASASFAEAAGSDRLSRAGAFTLRGVAEPQEAFTLSEAPTG